MNAEVIGVSRIIYGADILQSVLRKMGNSSGVIIPKPLIAEIGAQLGDSLDLVVDAGRIILTPVPAHPRAGWAEDAQRLAESGDDALVWPDFPNEWDKEWEW